MTHQRTTGQTRPPVTTSDAAADRLGADRRIEGDPAVLRSSAPGRMPEAVGQLVRVLRGTLPNAHRPFARLPTRAVRMSGREPASGHRLDLLYIGNGESLEYVRDLALASPTATVLESRSSPLAVRALLRRYGTGADVVVVDTTLLAERLLVARAFHRVPRWVKQTLAVGGSAPAVRARVGAGTLAWARRMLRRHDYRVDLALSEDAHLHFFRELYVPFVRARFGPDAIVVGERRFRREARGAGVLRLWAQDEVVAGVLVRAAGDELQIVWFGAKPDARERGFKGLSDVLDYAALCLARRGGFDRLHFGSSRPSLSDGVLRYKQKWGATVQPGRLPRADLRLAIDPTSAAARGFLERARLIVRARSGQLWELVPNDPTDHPEGPACEAFANGRAGPHAPELRRLDGLAAAEIA